MTQALTTFGVYGRPSEDELDVLELANEYRDQLCSILQKQHEDIVDHRNSNFPLLWKAMQHKETCAAEVYVVDKEIKAHHSEVRDRNAVTVEQRNRLVVAREKLKEAKAELSAARKPWHEYLKEYRGIFKAAEDWKNVKSLPKRKEAYQSLEFPNHLKDYAGIVLGHDIAMRELSEKYQNLGLQSHIRTEIVQSSKPKLTLTGPGIKYRYGRPPNPRPWKKILVQFGSGGLPLEKALQGIPSFELTPLYTNYKAGGEKSVYHVRQQIGTKDHPRLITYTVKVHKPIPAESVIQRWSLVIRDNRRYAIPLISNVDFTKPSDKGTLTYDLRWSSVEGGVLVCTFLGDHVNEHLILPRWLVDRRMELKHEQQSCDNTANDLLESRGIPRSKKNGSLHGVEALREYVLQNKDLAAGNAYDQLSFRMSRAKRKQGRALRCIEKIYETVTSRVCRLHDHLIPDTIDLRDIKRYDTRNLLKPDKLGPGVRELAMAVAPGKLKALLDKYGLAIAESPENFQGSAHKTDLFTTWVLSLNQKTGSKRQQKCHRFQYSTEDVGR
jgi:hypothetical protein